MRKTTNLINVIFIFMIVIVLYFQFSGHKKANKDNQSTQTKEYEEQGGLSLRYYDDQHTLTSKNMTHILDYQSSYTPYIEVGNNFSKEGNFRIFFFLDYKQIAVKLNKKEIKFFDLKLKPFDNEKIQIELPQIKKGRHDFIIVVSRIETTPTQTNYNNPYLDTIIKKTTIIKDQDTIPNIKFRNDTSIKYIESKPGTLFISEEPSIKLSKPKNIISGDFWLHIPSTKNNIAIIGILGKKQINIENEFISSDIYGYINLPFHINRMKRTGNLLLIVLERPFERMEDDSGKLIELHNYYLLNNVQIN